MKIRMRSLCWILSLLCLYAAGCAQEAYAQAPATGYYYSPATNLDQLDQAALSTAQQSIALASFSLSDPDLIQVLVDRAAHGVTERIYLDRGELQAQCRGDLTCARSPLHLLFGLPTVEIRVKKSKVLMHLKAYAVDLALIREGSANFSDQGERLQDNSAIFTQEPKAGAAFGMKFRSMWDRPDNLTVAQALVTTPDPTAGKPPSASPPIGQK